MPVVPDKRNHPRAEISCPITIQADERVIEGKVRNISLGGLLIHSEAIPDLGKPFKVNIKLPNSVAPVSALARAVRVHIQSEDNAPTSYILAVRFVDISEDFFDALRQLTGA